MAPAKLSKCQRWKVTSRKYGNLVMNISRYHKNDGNSQIYCAIYDLNVTIIINEKKLEVAYRKCKIGNLF